MSKEMAVIALGALVVATRTLLGVPGSWQTVILVAAGAAIMILGFLLRGEALSRAAGHKSRSASYLFEERGPAESAAEPTSAHEHKEGITSLN